MILLALTDASVHEICTTIKDILLGAVSLFIVLALMGFFSKD